MEGTLIDRNSFRESNQRCISVEGSSNVTISHNTAYKNKGHCIYIGFESAPNLIANNLVSDMLDIDTILITMLTTFRWPQKDTAFTSKMNMIPLQTDSE